MDVRSFFLGFIVIAYSCCLGIGYSQDIYNVQDFGATGNGQNDDSQAFLKAWNSACGTNKGTPIIRVSKGQTYLLNPLTFNGPCKSNSIRIQIDGNIVAPQTLAGWKAGCQYGRWLHFVQVNNLVISGTGTFDGRGSMWWRKATYPGCKAPTGLRFYRCDNLQLKGFTSVNSPNKHIVFQSCRNVFVDHLHIRAPSTSPNTDGIVISGSSQIGISESFIGTGDDCISIKSGSSYINITHVTCGPGHGISIGSLGIGGGNHTVEEVHVRNCSFRGTTNGARIKTWKGGFGYAKAISFEHIKIIASKNPIIIDQEYTALQTNTTKNRYANRNVKVSDVTYRDFTGTSISEEAITLDCASSGCSNIVMDRISLTPAQGGKIVTSFCKNAQGKASSTSPSVPCLSNPK